MSQSLPIDAYCRVHKKKLSDNEFIKTLKCFNCTYKKKKQRMCQRNVTEWLDLRDNNCEYYKEVKK